MMRLTGLGQLAMTYGVQTSPQWWRDVVDEVERIADADGDWKQLIEERIAGLKELARLRDTYGEPKNWPPR